MNREAMTLSRRQLLPAYEERIARKTALRAERERRLGEQRLRISGYMENLQPPELFGFDVNDLYRDPALAVEMQLRERIFWADNVDDDAVPGRGFAATVGMYTDVTLFGVEVRYERCGVPHIGPHALAAEPDLRRLQPFDFATSGDMPRLLEMYEAMRRRVRDEYGGSFTVSFPRFTRGPLDMSVHLRGYENLVGDMAARPAFVHDLIAFIVAERKRFREERARYLGEPLETAAVGIDDDWVNVPFISPAMFREFMMPAYRRIQEGEGTVKGFHSCGRIEPVAADLLATLPGIRSLDVSGWNDFEELDRLVAKDIWFHLNVVNTFVLQGRREEHVDKLRRIARVRKGRGLGVCVQAIVRTHEDFDEDLRRINDFIALAREMA